MTMTMPTPAPPAPQQLQMIWPMRRQPPLAPAAPPGYHLRIYREGDLDAYVQLEVRAGFTQWNAEKAQGVFANMHPHGLFFAVHNATGALAATAVAQAHPSELHPAGGELGWVAADPDHRGHGLGYIVCAAATRRLLEAGHGSIYLRTDDFRLPAIRVYLNLGWIPLLHGPDMAGRWRAICAGLGVPLHSLLFTTDPAGEILFSPATM